MKNDAAKVFGMSRKHFELMDQFKTVIEVDATVEEFHFLLQIARETLLRWQEEYDAPEAERFKGEIPFDQRHEISKKTNNLAVRIWKKCDNVFNAKKPVARPKAK